MYKKSTDIMIAVRHLEATILSLCFSRFWMAQLRIITLLSRADHEILTCSSCVIPQAVFKECRSQEQTIQLFKSEICL